MTGVVFIFFVAVLNVAMGFAVAAFLGARYREAYEPGYDWLGAEDDFASLDPGPQDGVQDGAVGGDELPVEDAEQGTLDGDPDVDDAEPPMAAEGQSPDETAEQVAADEPPGQSESAPTGESPDPDEAGADTASSRAAVSKPEQSDLEAAARGKEPDPEQLASFTPGEPPDSDDTTRSPLPSDGAADTTAEPAEAPSPKHDASLDTSPAQAAIDSFLAEIEEFEHKVTTADDQLRQESEQPGTQSIRECLQSLLDASQDYAEQRERSREGFDRICQDQPEFGMVRDDLEAAFQQQDDQIMSTRRAAEAFPYEHDTKAGCHVMLGETNKLIGANHHVRDVIGRAGIAVARGEDRLGNLTPLERIDELTGLETRTSLEGLLEAWYADPDAAPMTLAVIDIDQFTVINQRYGHNVGDELLRALGGLLSHEVSDSARAFRLEGQRFAIAFLELELRRATNAIERIRQTIEQSTFRRQDTVLDVSVSCGVAQLLHGETQGCEMTRATATLMEAKRYGRNRTFIHEGKYPTPVVPPNFTLEPRELTL